MRPDTALFTPQDAPDRLDPENWDDFVQFCGDRLQQIAQWMATKTDEPVYSPVTRSVRRAIAEEIPQQSQGLQQACDDLENYVLPHLAGNAHPRYFGPVQGAGTAGNVLAAMYAAL